MKPTASDRLMQTVQRAAEERRRRLAEGRVRLIPDPPTLPVRQTPPQGPPQPPPKR